MADEQQIRVVITGVASDLRRALDGAKGDLGGLKAAIKDVPNKIKVDVQAETAAATLRLKELRDIAKDVPDKISIKADADTGIASAKLRLLQSQIRDTESSLARVALGGGGGGGGLSGLSGLGSLGGSAAGGGGGLAGALAAGAPIIAAVAGSLTAIAGSAGAAALGVGALGTALAGVGAAGLGPLVLLSGGLKDAAALAGKLETAQTNLDAATKRYGASSTQAATAQKALNKLTDTADPAVLKFAQSWGKVTDALDNAEQNILPAFTTALKPILDTFVKLLPTIEQMARIDLRGVSAFVAPLLQFANSQAFKTAMLDLSSTFAKLGGPIGQTFENLMRAFLNVAVAASPFLIQIADALRSWSASFANSLTPGQHLTDLISGLVGQLQSWWNLAKSLGGLMVTIFSAGAGTGQTLVNLLTGIVRQWNAWLNTKAGQEAMKTFFTQSAALVTALVKALAPLLAAVATLIVKMMPTFTKLITDLTPALNGLAQIIGVVATALSSKLVAAFVDAAIKFNPTVLVLSNLPQILGWVAGAVNTLGDAWNTIWSAITTAFKGALNFILGGISTLLGAVKEILTVANLNLPIVGHIFGSTFGDAATSIGNAQTAIDRYRSTLEPTKTATQTNLKGIDTSFQDLAINVPAYMNKVLTATTQGLTNVDKELIAALTKLGIKPTRGIVTGLTTFPGQPGSLPGFTSNPQNPLPNKAGGGLVQVGREGQKGRDSIPLSVGGTDIVVGAGEKVAVFNDEQQKVADHFMAPVGGLGGMFKRFRTPHYMTTGGAVPGAGGYEFPFSGSGWSWSRTDQGQDFGGNSPIGAIGDARVTYSNPADGWYSPAPAFMVYELLGGPDAGKDIYVAEHISSMAPTGTMVKAGQAVAQMTGGIEMGWAAGPQGHQIIEAMGGDHLTAAGQNFHAFLTGLQRGKITGGGAFGTTGGAAAPWTNITAPKWTGPGGPMGAIGQGVVAKVVAAANTFGQGRAGSGGGGGGGSTAGLSGNLRAIVGQLSKRFGWTGQESDWLQVIQQESGGSMTAKNPGSGAYGIAQFINGPGAYATYGGNVNTMAGQLLAMANYIKGRYGGPSAAEAHERAFNWYSGGGFADLVKTLPPGGGRAVDIMTSGSIDSGGNSGGFNQAGSSSIFGRIPTGPNAGPWWAEGDRGASIGTSFGGKRGGQAARFTFGNKSTIAVKVDTGNGNSFGDIYPPADAAIGFDRVGRGGPVKVDFLSDSAARALLGGHGPAGATGPRPTGSVIKPGGFGPGVPKSAKLAAVPGLPGFDPTDMAKIASIDDYVNNKLPAWQGLITGEHSRQAVVPLVTLADGSQVVNWDGMTDPVTGAFDKGIHQRLAEIGHLGGAGDLNTELGIDQIFLNQYFAEALAAGRAQSQFGPWLKRMRADHSKQQAAAVDDQATHDRLTVLKAALPQQKIDRTAAITRRFAAARHKIQTSGAKGTFSASALLSEQLAGLTAEEKAAKAGVPAVGWGGWKGTHAGWVRQRTSELAGITSEFAARRAALTASAKASKFEGTLKKSNALFGLTAEEHAEKLKLSDSFATRRTDFTAQIKAAGAAHTRDKFLQTSDETALTAAVGNKDGTLPAASGSFEDTLQGLLSPMGPLQLAIAQKQQIDIPNLLDEIAALTGTKVPASAAGGSNLSSLLALNAQLLAQTQQALATSQSQTAALSGFMPLLTGRLVGSFQSGIDFVPHTGLAMVHRGETITPDPYGPHGNRAATAQTAQGPVEIIIQMGNDEKPLMKIISATMNQQALRVVSDHSGQRARLLSGVRRP